MNTNSDSRYPLLYKPAMLGFFALGIIIAGMMVSKSRTIEYTPLIELKGMGISVSVPSSRQWQRPSAGWQYEKNVYSLSSILQLSSQSAISAQWRYSLLSTSRDVEEIFARKAQSIFGELTIGDSRKIGDTVLHTAKIVSEKKQVVVHIAGLQTSIGHLLTLEVVQRGAPAGMAVDIFDKLTSTMEYSDSELLVNGSELVADFKTFALRQIHPDHQGIRYYLIKNSDDQAIGFVAGGITDSGESDSSQPITVASLYYTDNPTSEFSEQSFIRTDTRLGEFEWVTRRRDFRANREVAIKSQQDPNGIMSVELMSVVKVGDFLPSKVAVPDVLFDQFVVMFTQKKFQNALVDILLIDGQVIPTALSVLLQPVPSEYAYVVLAEFNDGKNRQQKMYIDSAGEIVRIEVDTENDYVIEAVSAKDVLGRFASWTQQIDQTRQQLMAARRGEILKEVKGKDK
ncbi:MAG: hypothetical protein K8R02_03140 [Anaerohalosphaeraceae bacterium]|nr:hypothetical protein [Anaerohalosphaeraceae bacterium]